MNNDKAIAAAQDAVNQAVSLGDDKALKKHLSALRALGVSKLTQKDGNGATPLSKAAESGTAHAVEILIEWCDVDAPDAAGNTALFSAAYQGNLDSVRLLAKAGDPLATNVAGQTAANYAVAMDHVEIVDFLVNRGALLNSSRYSETLLHAAARAGAVKCARFLVDRVDPDAPNANGGSALALAIEEDCVEIAAILAPFSGLGSMRGYTVGRESAWAYSAFTGAARCLKHFLSQVEWRHTDSDGHNVFDFCLSFSPPSTRAVCVALLEGAIPLDIGREMVNKHGKEALPLLLARIESHDLEQVVGEIERDGKENASSPSTKNRESIASPTKKRL